MAEEQNKDEGLHVDQDWKAEVKAEKERLAREDRQKEAADRANERKRAEGVIGGDEAGAEQQGQGELPPADFTMLVNSLATQALLLLNPQSDPETGKPAMDLDLAKHSIDLLGVLEEKTKGNLTEQEKSLLDTALYQVRMAYVSASRTI